MNAADILTQTGQHAGTLHCGGMGAHQDWERNNKHAVKIGAQQQCHHCGKAMTEGNGWKAIWAWATDRIHPLDADVESVGGEWINLGNECAKRFGVNVLEGTHFVRIGEVK